MPPECLLLHFDDPNQASSLLALIGIRFDERGSMLEILRGDGVPRQATGETVDFEGESLPLTKPVPGLHIKLAWQGELPMELAPYLVKH